MLKRLAQTAIRVVPLMRGRGAELVPVLRYHSLDETGSCISTPPSAFRAHLAFLARHGLRAVSLRDHALLDPDEAAATVVVTFDDGFQNNLDVALPALREHGGTATFYVVAGCVGAPPAWTQRDLAEAIPKGLDAIDDLERFLATAELDDAYVASHLPTLYSVGRERCLREYYELGRTRRFELMDWEGVRALHGSGMEVGSHTVDHRHLSDVDAGERRRQIADSKRILEEQVDAPVEAFCYPYGTIPDEAPDEVRSAGYTTATSCERGFHAPGRDPFRMARLEMEPIRDEADLAFWLLPQHRGLLDRVLPKR